MAPDVWQHDLYEGPKTKRVQKPTVDLRQTLSTTKAARQPRQQPAHEAGELLISNLEVSVTAKDIQVCVACILACHLSLIKCCLVLTPSCRICLELRAT